MEWIREQLDSRNIPQAELAVAIGISPSQLNKTLSGTRVLKSTEADDIRRYFGYKIPEEVSPIRVENDEPAPPNRTLVSVMNIAASAGAGTQIDIEEQIYSLSFPPQYLKKLTSSSPKNLAIISVKGESMEPTLLDDDIVLLDASKTNLSYDGLFVLRFNDALHVKRIGRSAKPGHVMIISDNSALYPPLDASISDVSAVGKVLWYGRKV